MRAGGKRAQKRSAHAPGAGDRGANVTEAPERASVERGLHRRVSEWEESRKKVFIDNTE